MPEFPPVAGLLPHRGRAVLLRRVLAHDATSTICEVDPAASVLWASADGSVPATVALEYMAQTVAAHGGLSDREAGREARPGFFLGSRRLDFRVQRFEPGELLEVTARHLRGSAGMLAFECSVRRAAGSPDPASGDRPSEAEVDAGAPAHPMVSGVLTVYLLESFEALARDFAEAGPGDAS